MSNYRVGDEVLVKAGVVHPCDCDGDMQFSLFHANGMKRYAFCGLSEVVGLASEFERQEWVRTDERLPEHGGYYWVMFDDNVSPELDWFFIGDNQCWRSGGQAVAWMPFVRPDPYIPPAPKWDCGKCVHEAVCVFRVQSMRREDAPTCGGVHYA